MNRHVVQAEALAWLGENPASADASVVTSLPDVSEVPLDLTAWRAWFVDAVARVVLWTPADSVAIFYQSDVRIGGAWIDKGYLVLRGAEAAGATTLWHKIVCRKPAGTIALGRPSYSHMIAVSLAPRAAAPRRPGPDVLPDAGAMTWSRAMGVTACKVACGFLRDETSARVVVDPFCGRGTVLAVANAMGFDAIGVDLSAKRCRAARAIVLGSDDGSENGGARSASESFRAGARSFDAGAFWEAHEAWEAQWRVERDDGERRVLQGLIQIAAAFHQLRVVQSEDAAMRLLAKGLAKIETWPSDLDLTAFRSAALTCARAIRDGRASELSIPKIGPQRRLVDPCVPER